jgi:hypothetical protein
MVSPSAKTCRVAFKEWAGVCDALVEGRQTLVVRKGGISETAGPGGFAPEYPEFWLYPTWVHQAEQGLRTNGAVPASLHRVDREGSVLIRGLVCVDVIGYVKREQTLSSLEEFHIYTGETILRRFHYRRPGFWALGARVWRCDPGFTLAPSPEQAGCKTWVLLEEPLPTAGLQPVLDDAEWAIARDRLRAILDREN